MSAYSAHLEKGLVTVRDAHGLPVATLYANDAAALALARQFAAASALHAVVDAFADSFDESGMFNFYRADFSTEQLHAMARAALRRAKGRP